MEKYVVEEAQFRAAILELLTDILAQQSGLAELMVKQMAGGDDEKYQILAADLEQKVQTQWHRVFDNISTVYAQLPLEIWELIYQNRSGGGEA